MRGGWEACLDWFWHWDICSVLCVVCLLDWWDDWGWRVMNWWQEGHWLQTIGPIIKGSEMHKFTVTGITSGNRDYRGQEISCVLANRNLNLLGGCCLENQVNHKWLWEQQNCDLMFRPCQHTQTLDKLLVVNKTTCSVKRHRDRKIKDLSAAFCCSL